MKNIEDMAVRNQIELVRICDNQQGSIQKALDAKERKEQI